MTNEINSACMKFSFCLPSTSKGVEVLGFVNGKRITFTKAGKELLGVGLGWHSREELRGAAKFLAAESAAVSCNTYRGFLVQRS